MTYQEQIDHIMDEFDFARVRQMMADVGWNWGWDSEAHIPDEVELRRSARGHLRACAFDGNAVSGSGGFTAMKDDGRLCLFWGIDSYGIMDGVEASDE